MIVVVILNYIVEPYKFPGTVYCVHVLIKGIKLLEGFITCNIFQLLVVLQNIFH